MLSAAHADAGPALPPRGLVHQQALELAALARRAAEFSSMGPHADLALALLQFERMRAVLGASGPEIPAATSGAIVEDDDMGGAIDG